MSCPQFQQLRRWIADGAMQAVGTLDRDRLQAQGLQRLIFLSECRDKGIPIITVQGAPMLEGGEGQLVELALALGKERSVLRAQQGARDGLRDRARLKGLPANYSAPFGLRWVSNQLVPSEQYPVAQEIWRMALTGTTLWGIAAELTRRGIPTPKGAPVWASSTIGAMLRNRTYAGVVEALKKECVAPKHRSKDTYGKSSSRLRPPEERIPLNGLVVQPVVTEAEFAWVQQRLAFNQQFASKNTRLRTYLLRGLIRCALCGRSYCGKTVGPNSYYYCGGQSHADWGAVKCPAQKFHASRIEAAAFGMVTEFLRGPEGFLSEMRRRKGLQEHSEKSIHRELDDLQRQERASREAEAKAFRLAASTNVSEDVFQQEVGLIRARQKWIREQRDRLLIQLADVQRYTVDASSIKLMRERLESRVVTATAEDRRFILEALGTQIIAHGDGTWELQLEVPRQIPQQADIVSTRPGP